MKNMFNKITLIIVLFGLIAVDFSLVSAASEDNIGLSVVLPPEDGGGTNVFGYIGIYPTIKGTILVTDDKYKDIAYLGHSGIVYSSTKIIESNLGGVEIGNNDWYITKNQVYGVTVNGLTNAQRAAAADRASLQLGKPYNLLFMNMNTRSSFYCSHLIWAMFIDLYGIDLNTEMADTDIGAMIHPMELVLGPNTTLVYQKKR